MKLRTVDADPSLTFRQLVQNCIRIAGTSYVKLFIDSVIIAEYDEIVPINVVLEFGAAGRLNQGTHTITINSAFDALPIHIFIGTGQILGLVDPKPEWTGGVHVSTPAYVSYVSNYATIDAAITALNATGNKEILVLNAPSTLVLSVASNTTVEIITTNKGLVTLSAGKSLTINGPFSGESYQVFTGSGTVVFPTGATVREIWFNDLAKALTATPLNGVLECEGKTYSVAYATLVLSVKYNILIKGKGCALNGAGTIWQASGNAASSSVPFLELTGGHDIIFENIGFWGSGQTGIGVYIHRGPAAEYSSAIKFQFCYFRNFAVGVHIGNLTTVESNNENMTFFSCQWLGNLIGYRQYWPNALQNSMYDPLFTNGGTDIWLSNSTHHTGSLVLFNANFAVTADQNIYFENPADLQIHSFRSENVKQFMVCASTFVGGIFMSTQISGGITVAQTVSNLPLIRMATMGLVATNCQFGDWNDAKTYLDFRGANSNATFINCRFNAYPTYGPPDTVDKHIFGTEGRITIIGCNYYYSGDSSGRKLVNNTFSAYDAMSGATPDLSLKGNQKIVLDNATPTNVTNFLNGYEDQELTVYIGSNTTVVHGANMQLHDGTNKTSGVIQLQLWAGIWYQL